MPRGYTLIELVFVLTLLAAGASVSAPAARKWSDRAAVVMAREDVVAALLGARTMAVVSGGSTVTLVARPASFRFDTDFSVGALELAGWDSTVAMGLGAGSDSVTIRFDALGVGRFSSRTIRLTRAGTTASVVISSYGRVVRR